MKPYFEATRPYYKSYALCYDENYNIIKISEIYTRNLYLKNIGG
jgi:hypothetical protein